MPHVEQTFIGEAILMNLQHAPHYGLQMYNGKTYFVYNSWQMKKKTHGEMLESHNVKPIIGKNTPVRRKRNELMGCTVFCIEVIEIKT